MPSQTRFLYIVKKVSDFSVPSRDVTYQTLPGIERVNYSPPGRAWLVTSRLGTGKSITLLQCNHSNKRLTTWKECIIRSISGIVFDVDEWKKWFHKSFGTCREFYKRICNLGFKKMSYCDVFFFLGSCTMPWTTSGRNVLIYLSFHKNKYNFSQYLQHFLLKKELKNVY